MQKLLFISLLFLSANVYADCIGVEHTIIPEKCAAFKDKIICPQGTIYTVVDVHDPYVTAMPEYVGKCIPCDAPLIPVYPGCTSVSEARARCPDRYIEYGCGTYSVRSCSSHTIVDEQNKTCTNIGFL